MFIKLIAGITLMLLFVLFAGLSRMPFVGPMVPGFLTLGVIFLAGFFLTMSFFIKRMSWLIILTLIAGVVLFIGGTTII